jgi:hypothetical protein
MTAPVTLPLFRRRSASAGAAVAMLALALAGCGAADDPGTGAPVSTESTSTDESPTPGGSEGSTGSASAPETPGASPEASGGQFVPASSEGPAQNVPVPEMPAVAKERTQEGLEAALEYWWEANFYLKTTGDAGPLESISADTCEICRNISESWPDVYAASGWAELEPIDVKVLDTRASESDSLSVLTFQVTDGPSSLYKPGGILVEEGSLAERQTSYWSGSASFSGSKRHWLIENLRLVRTE